MPCVYFLAFFLFSKKNFHIFVLSIFLSKRAKRKYLSRELYSNVVAGFLFELCRIKYLGVCPVRIL